MASIQIVVTSVFSIELQPGEREQDVIDRIRAIPRQELYDRLNERSFLKGETSMVDVACLVFEQGKSELTGLGFRVSGFLF